MLSFGSWCNFLFAAGSFLGDGLELTVDISGPSSSSDVLQKVHVLVGSSSRNGFVAMLGLAVQITTLLA